MKLKRSTLRALIKEELQRVEERAGGGVIVENVSPMRVTQIFNELKSQGRNRSLTRGDEMDAQNFIKSNMSAWIEGGTSRGVKDAIIGYLVKKGFGYSGDYK